MFDSSLLLIPAGFLAGVINTIAGGGSFLTLPALMFLSGLDPLVANGTNRVAILFSSGTASLSFSRQGHLDMQLARRLAWPTLCGVPIGAGLAIYLPSQAFEGLFGLAFLAMAIVMALNPKRFLAQQPKGPEVVWKIWITFFCIGVYVGFMQAGMGILLLLGMNLLRTGDLVASNGVKNLIGFLVTLAAAIIFVGYGLIAWLPAFTTAIGNVLGGYVGAKLAIRKGNRLIFVFMVGIMLFTGVRLVLKSF